MIAKSYNKKNCLHSFSLEMKHALLIFLKAQSCDLVIKLNFLLLSYWIKACN